MHLNNFVWLIVVWPIIISLSLQALDSNNIQIPIHVTDSNNGNMIRITLILIQYSWLSRGAYGCTDDSFAGWELQPLFSRLASQPASYCNNRKSTNRKIGKSD